MVYHIHMAYTIKQIGTMAGISNRTLHHYDAIGLLQPTKSEANGYRQYSDADLIRLQQILFYRELGMPLEKIKRILDNPSFDALQALEEHKAALELRASQMRTLIHTVEKTIAHLKGKIDMENNELFKGFSEAQQKEYEKEARQLWGDDIVGASTKRWNDYSKEKQKQILAEAGEIYRSLASNLDKAPGSPQIQALIKRWHQNLRYFYEPTNEILLGLTLAYNEHPGFQKTFRAFHPDLAAYMKKAVEIYVKTI
jgi:DNA-binding transcriptional MerR regulator